MNKLINYIKSMIEILILLLFSSIFITILYYFEILSSNIINIINYIIIIILFFLLGYKSSKRNKSKGYLSGIISSSSLSLLFIFISLISKEFIVSSLIYYLTLIASSTIGGILGIPKEN